MDNIAIKVDSVDKTFKLPHARQRSIKGLFVNMFRTKRTIEEQKVLKNISFNIEKGEFFAIVGKNGSGKSTLLKLLAGIYSPTKGAIHVNGKLTPFIELGVGFNPDLTGRENVFLNGALLGFNRREMLAMYDDIVSFAELERFMDQKLKNYSSGMQVRLAFSIAIRARSDILLLDEVLAVGDAAFQQKCYDYFETLKKQRKTVVFVSHDMAAVRRFCTKAVYIKGGKLIKIGSPTDIADIYMEENMQSINDSKESPLIISNRHSLSGTVKQQTADNLTLGFEYVSQEGEELYLGISILKDGVSVGEITTINEKPLVQSGHVQYKLNTSHLNAGVYRVEAALFKTSSRELVAVNNNKLLFMLKGIDDSRGGSMKLEANWKF